MYNSAIKKLLAVVIGILMITTVYSLTYSLFDSHKVAFVIGSLILLGTGVYLFIKCIKNLSDYQEELARQLEEVDKELDKEEIEKGNDDVVKKVIK